MSNKPNENPDKKDFLSSLVSDTKPESFAQEEVTRIEKRPFKLDKTLLAILGGAAVIVAVASWFLFFAPNVKMGDFVGKNVSEVQIWVRQNSIASTDIIISERYDFNTAKDVVIEQSLAPNTAFRKGTKKITIVVSLGPDPDEKITFPDLANMNYSEITAWRDSNKLLNVSIKQVYSSTVEEGNVISYDLRNVPEGDFTRGTSLTINISRGPQPVGQVEVVNYEGKTLMEFETWASGKGLKYSSSESYSDTVQEGLIISQSIKSGTVDAGTEITVVVSKGKAATMTNLVGKSDTQAQAWCSANGVNCQVQEVYHNTALPHTVVKQSAGSGSIVDAKTIVELQVSLGRVDFKTFTGSTISELRVWVEEMNYKQAGLNLVEHKQDSTLPINTIIRIDYPVDPTKDGYLNYGAKIEVWYSDGGLLITQNTYNVYCSANGLDPTKISVLIQYLAANNISYNLTDSSMASGTFTDVTNSTGGSWSNGAEIRKGETVTIIN